MKKILTALVLLCSGFVSQGQVTYSISTIPYAPDPYNVGTNVGITQDDYFSGVIPIGFTFNFFGNNYNSMVISSNGSVTFNTSNANSACMWATNGITLPDATESYLFNSILSPFQDIDPSVTTSGSNNIRVAVKGVAPYRRCVISYDSISLFSCNTIKFSNQIILYETTHIIDINIQNKPICTNWNGGVAFLGVQNDGGTVAYLPTGYNGTQWTASQESWRFTPSNAGPSNPNTCKVKGSIFFDANGNCINDVGEWPNINRFVLTASGNYYAYTDVNGNYEMAVPPGTHNIIHSPYGQVNVLCPVSNSYTVNLLTAGDSVTNIDFGDSTMLAADLAVSIGTPSLRWCDSNYMTIMLVNWGALPEYNALAILTVPDSVNASNFSLAPSSQVGNIYTFQIDTLLPGQVKFLTFTSFVWCDTNLIGSTKCFPVSITGTATEFDISNNNSSNCYVVVSSYDPNNLEASVEHIANGPFVESGSVIPNEWITYKVNFQNTGTAMALNIRVEDMIDSTTLDMSTAKFVGASHACTMLKDNHLLKFYLNGIDLMDSNTNEELSHGWIMFKIKSKFTLSNGDQVLNTAGIYFDNNPVVITNTNVLQYGTPEGLATVSSKESIKIYPNPMDQQATLVLPKQVSNATLRMYNRLGACVYQQLVNGQQIYLQRQQLADGLYMVEVNDGATIYHGKINLR